MSTTLQAKTLKAKDIKRMHMDSLKEAFKGVRDFVVMSVSGLTCMDDNKNRLALRKKGIRLQGMDPEIVELGGEISEDDLLFHDERQREPSLAYLLSRMHAPEFPEPMGVFRCVERPSYEDMVMGQVRQATEQQGLGDLNKLYDDGETWVVN